MIKLTTHPVYICLCIISISTGFTLRSEIKPTLNPEPEFWSLDQSVRRNFSLEAQDASYIGFYATHLIPMASILSQDEKWGVKARDLGIFASAVSLNLILTGATKAISLRARPYTHHPSNEAKAHVEQQGIDNYFSFYSGHASVSFAGATSGSLLASKYYRNDSAKNFLWASQFAFASSATILRVRAGKHYYSDVIVGAIMGALVGVKTTLHLSKEKITVSNSELVSAGIGSILGYFSYYYPFKNQDIKASSKVWIQPVASLDRSFGLKATLLF